MNALAIPQLPGLPLLGSVVEFRYRTLELFMRVLHECGAIGAFRTGPWTIVMLNAPEYVQAVLVDHADRIERVPRLRGLMEPTVGNGLINAEGAFHRRQRKLVAPAFQHRRIASYADVMAQYSEALQQTWTDGETVDIAYEMMRLTLRIVGKTLFDADVLSEAAAFGQALTTAMHATIDRATTIISPPLSWPTPGNRNFRRAIARLDATVYRIIDERRTHNQDRGDLLSMLLEAQDEDDGSRMTDQQVRDEAMTLLLAGHDTTANALTWTWYLLMQHPHVYQRVRAEVDQVLAGRAPTMHDLAHLPYLLQVFKEALRLYPPAYIVARSVVRPIELDGYQLKPGMNIGICSYTLHRNPTYFPDPERFDPERWTPENEANIPRYAYLPFGAGPHVCIGNHFAMMEAQLVLATLVQRVTFDLVPGQTVEPEPLITLRPKDGIRVVVRRR
jgi:cytochrome P450